MFYDDQRKLRKELIEEMMENDYLPTSLVTILLRNLRSSEDVLLTEQDVRNMAHENGVPRKKVKKPRVSSMLFFPKTSVKDLCSLYMESGKLRKYTDEEFESLFSKIKEDFKSGKFKYLF